MLQTFEQDLSKAVQAFGKEQEKIRNMELEHKAFVRHFKSKQSYTLIQSNFVHLIFVQGSFAQI